MGFFKSIFTIVVDVNKIDDLHFESFSDRYLKKTDN